MIRYLLDTNACSYAVRNYSLPFSRRFASTALGAMVISVITEAELLFGLERRPERYALAVSVHELLRRITVLPWTSAAAKQYSVLRADLERTGRPMDDMDMMIAAHALAEDLVLVTNDAAFHRIGHLRTQNWTV